MISSTLLSKMYLTRLFRTENVDELKLIPGKNLSKIIKQGSLRTFIN